MKRVSSKRLILNTRFTLHDSQEAIMFSENPPKQSRKKTSSEALKSIKAIAMDVDGVLTDGMLYLSSRGEELKAFHVQDGLGVVLAKRSGLIIAWISSRQSKALALRARELGIDALYQNCTEKFKAFQDFLRKFHLMAHEVCYIGDDLIDIPILNQAGFAVAVCNAVNDVKKCAGYVTQFHGGRGAVREVIEKIMKIQRTWNKQIEPYVK